MATFMSILTLLETKLPQHCHITGTSIHENSIRVSIAPNPGEIFRFFLTDDEYKSARACFAMTAQGIGCCDFLLVHSREDSMHERDLLCFIELKGKDLKHAVDQICDTYKPVTQFLQQRTNSIQRTNVIEAAAIFLSHRAPSGVSIREKTRLAKIFKDTKNIYIKHCAGRNNPDFSQFIRTIYA